jgi:hypothetical protein
MQHLDSNNISNLFNIYWYDVPVHNFRNTKFLCYIRIEHKIDFLSDYEKDIEKYINETYNLILYKDYTYLLDTFRYKEKPFIRISKIYLITNKFQKQIRKQKLKQLT